MVVERDANITILAIKQLKAKLTSVWPMEEVGFTIHKFDVV